MNGVRHPLEEPRSSTQSRLRALVGKFPSPAYLWFLGLLSLPSIFFGRLEQFSLFVLFFLFGLWPLIALVVPGDRNEGTVEPTAWIDFGAQYEHRAMISSVLVGLQPFVLWASLRQLAGVVFVKLRFRGRLPEPGRFQQSVSYRLPFEGEWTVVNGSPDRRHSHSWSIPSQRYAYDFFITDADGRTHDGERIGPEAHYCFDEPILAPADGTVVAIRTDHRDYHRTDGWIDPLQRDLRGNYVTIQHAEDEFSVLAHLRCESVTVENGDEIRAGQEIGRCGHSGNSTEPHLHFQVQDRMSFFSGTGLPVTFSNLTTCFSTTEPTHHERGYIHAGALVKPTE